MLTLLTTVSCCCCCCFFVIIDAFVCVATVDLIFAVAPVLLLLLLLLFLFLLLVVLPLLAGGDGTTAAVAGAAGTAGTAGAGEGTPFGDAPRAPPAGADGLATGRVHTFAFFCPVLKDVFVSHVISKLNTTDRWFFKKVNRESWDVLAYAGVDVSYSVSYTHLTLPTILRV